MTRSRILVVEDDPRLAATLERVLKAEGHDVECAPDGADALRRARERSVDLVVLDLMLPGLDGISVCKRLRATSAVPILMLTALGGTERRGRGGGPAACGAAHRPSSASDSAICASSRRATAPGEVTARSS